MDPDPGRREHYRDFYAPDDAPSGDRRPLWLLWGNCQAEALRLVLDRTPDRPFRTARIPPVHELTRDDVPYLLALLDETVVLLTQPVRAGYRDLPIGAADLVDQLRGRATVIRWPVIRYAGLYPFQVIARHPADRSITPPGVPYHDLRTVAAARDGRRPTQDWDVEVGDDTFRAVADASIAELARRESRDTDVGVSDVLAVFGADAAHTINHPGNSVLHELARRLLATQNITSVPLTIAEPLLDATWAPLEQRVLDALGLTATPRPRWRHLGREIEPDAIHAIQLDWYSQYPDFIDLTIERHGATMAMLGLGGPR